MIFNKQPQLCIFLSVLDEQGTRGAFEKLRNVIPMNKHSGNVPDVSAIIYM